MTASLRVLMVKAGSRCSGWATGGSQAYAGEPGQRLMGCLLELEGFELALQAPFFVLALASASASPGPF